MTEPVYNWNRGFRSWNRNQIYTGDTGTGIYVPNVDDEVIEWNTDNSHVKYRVTAVDTNTYLSTLAASEQANTGGGEVPENVLLGNLPGETNSFKRLLLNTTASPYVMAFDHRARFYGNQGAYVKVFRGVDISGSGTVVSAIYSGGLVTSDSIPVQTILVPNGNNLAIKVPQVAWSTEDMPDGELCTVVLYSTSDVVLSIDYLIVMRTEFVRHLNDMANYIIDTELVSSLMSINDNTMIEIPVNATLASLGLQGKVRYADASEELLPIDGTRFTLLGIDNYVASVPNMPSPLVLSYKLQGTEQAINVVEPTPGNRFINKPYRIMTREAQNQYSVKLFVVPTWVTTPAPKWVLEYWLYSLDRQQVYYATPYVQLTANSAAYDGSLLNIRQQLQVAVNVNQVSTDFDIFRHVQNFAITLKASGSYNGTNSYFSLEYTNDHFYGAPNVALAGNDEFYPGKRKLNLSMNLMDLNDWLAIMYTAAEPLRLAAVEAYPPNPTHFRLRIGPSWVREIPIENALEIVRDINTTVIQGTTVRLEFFLRNNAEEHELSIASMTVKV